MIKWVQGSSELQVFNRIINVSCDVRNELNKRRFQDQIVYSIPDKMPYYPRIFPIGTWKIERPIRKINEYLEPFYIPTNAFQMLPIWEIYNGRYVKKTNNLTKDQDYGLHYSSSNTTLGCIKIIKREDLLWLVKKINESIDNKIDIYLEVTK